MLITLTSRLESFQKAQPQMSNDRSGFRRTEINKPRHAVYSSPQVLVMNMRNLITFSH